MSTTKTWNILPNERPKEDGSYLVHIRQDVALKLGLGHSVPVAIATYKMIDRKWSHVGGITPYTFPDDEIIEWHEIPKFP